MNKRQGTLFNFGVKKPILKVFVTQQIMTHPPEAHRAIFKMCQRRVKLPTHVIKILFSLVNKWTNI